MKTGSNAADLFSMPAQNQNLFQKEITTINLVNKLPDHPPTSFSTIMKYVTPEEASEWLIERNLHNRAMKKSHLRNIKQQMADGNFHSLNGQSIVFSITGKLLDGQHRLQSMADLNMGFWFNIVTGVPDEYFTTIDSGVKRSTSDAFEIKGIKYSAGISASVGFYLKLIKNPKSVSSFGSSGFGITVDDVLATYEKNEELFQRLYVEVSNYVKNFKILSAAQLTGIMSHTILTSKYGDSAEKEFWIPLLTGENMSDNIKMLRNKLIASLGHVSVKTPLIVKFTWIAKLYNAHFANKPIVQLRYDPQAEFPKII